MPDLIGAFERVRRVYRWYIEKRIPAAVGGPVA